MCTVFLPPGDNPIAVNKYIILYSEQGRVADSCEHHCNGAAGYLSVVSFLAGSVEMDTS
jgi:hypothetical protein